MTCYHPIKACYSKSDYAKSGQKHIHLLVQSDTKEATLINHQNYPEHLYEYIYLPCRKCAGCASDKAKEWSLRAQNEMQMHKDNCFITLTYDNVSELVMSDPVCLASLRYEHFQNFMKRLRKRFPKDKISYMVCGEYGHKDGRAHWHAILFGFDFPDKELVYVKNTYRHYYSQILQECWSTYDKSNKIYHPVGFIDLANCDVDCCNYVSQYVLKKLPVGEKGQEINEYIDKDGVCHQMLSRSYDRVAPFVRTSRNPAVGLRWYQKFGQNCVKNGFVTVPDKKKTYTKRIKTPNYYFDKFEQIDPETAKNIKECNTEKMKKYYAKNPVDRSKLSTWEQSHLYRISKRLKECLTKYIK